MISIVYRIATGSIKYAWDSGIEISIINEPETGVDQDMASTHHDLNSDDVDMTTKENKEPLEFKSTLYDT